MKCQVTKWLLFVLLHANVHSDPLYLCENEEKLIIFYHVHVLKVMYCKLKTQDVEPSWYLMIEPFLQSEHPKKYFYCHIQDIK